MAELSHRNGQLGTEELLSSIGKAVQNILVKQAWLHAMSKVGIGPKLSGLRASLASLIADVNMDPKPPSDSEL